MKERWTKKLIRKTKIGTVKRIVQSKSISQYINVEKAFVTNTDQLEERNGYLYSTGNDPKVFIRFHRPVKELSVRMKIKTDNPDDKIELFYSDITKNCVDFSYNECYRLGRVNQDEICKNIIFHNPVQYLRLDFGQHEGKIEMDCCSIKPERTIGAKDYNEYGEVFDEIKDTNNKKIVIVTHALNETGAPLLAYNISKNFKDINYDVAVIALSDGYLDEKYKSSKIPLFSLHQDPLSKEVYNVKALENIISTLRDKGYDKVITNTIVSGITAPLFKKYDFDIVSLIHEMRMSILLYDMMQGGRDISMYSDKIVFPDNIVYDEFKEMFGEDNKKSIIRPQGLYQLKESIKKDYNKVYTKYNLPTNAKIIMGSGTADLRKGIDLFLNAAQKLIQLEEDEEYHFIWTGKILNEEIKEWYKLQFEKFGIENRFHNVDFIKDKVEYQNLVACSDAFWLTSREDPFPSVMIEALEFSTPVLAFDKSGGAITLLDDGRGVLVDNFDVYELARRTHEILKNPDEIEKMIVEAQNYIAKNLQFVDYISDLENIFDEIHERKMIKPDISDMADVSVIVPNYNYEEYLPVRLKSIINQTVKPKEIILLDDVSTDNSIEVAESILKDAKKNFNINYRIVKNEVNNGCFKQWIKGIKLAKYPYLWIAEADDYAQENFIETLLPAFDDKKVVLAYAKSNVIDETCKVVNYEYTSYTDDLSMTKWNNNFKENGVKQVKKYFSKKNIIPNASSALIRKSAVDKIEDVLENYQVIGDWIAYIYILSHGEVAYFSNALNGHRRHSNSIIARKEKSIKFIEEILKIKKYVVENFKLSDNELNALLLSIENLENDYDKIQKSAKLRNIWESLKNQIIKKREKENILIVVPDLNVGGGQTVAIRLANSMRKYYNVFLINARSNLETDFMKQMISDDIVILNYNNSIENIRNFNNIFNFRAVISLIWWSDKLAHYAFGNDDIPWIISMHGCYEMLLHHPEIDIYFEKNIENMLNRANKIVYTAEKNKEILEKYNLLDNPKVLKIDNGFLLENYPKKTRGELGIRDDEFVFGLVARAIKEKGYSEAIEALNIVNEKSDKKSHLILVGGSSYIDELKLKYHDNQYIHFIDEFTEPMEWIGWEELFDVGLLPSYFKSESLPTVIVEYLYLGKPVIATDIAEIKSMIESKNEKAGKAIPLKNGKADVNELASEMLHLMNDKNYYNELSKNTKKFAKRFDMDLCIEKYKNLIEEEYNER